MADPASEPLFQRAKSGQVRGALDRLEGLVVEGLKHGFFDYSIACEIANGGKRQLVIRAGKSHKFTIPLSHPAMGRGTRPNRLKVRFG